MPDNSLLFKENYVPEPWAIPYHLARDKYRVRTLFGATGSGKTHVHAAEWIRMAYEWAQPPKNCTYVGVTSTRERAKDIMFDPVLQAINDDLIVDIKRNPFVIIMQAQRGHAVMRFEGSDDSNVKAEKKKRGFECEAMWVSEANTLSKEVVMQLGLRLRHSLHPKFLIDCNPDDMDDHILELFFPGAKKQIPELALDSHWKEGLRINPATKKYWQSLTILHNTHNNPDEVQEIITNAGDVKGYNYRRMVLGHPCSPEGSAFKRPVSTFQGKMVYA